MSQETLTELAKERGTDVSSLIREWVDHQIEALTGIRSVADNIAEAENFLDALAGNVGHNGLQSFKIAVDVADYRTFHRRDDLIIN